MCTGLLPPGANPIAVKILIIIIIAVRARRMFRYLFFTISQSVTVQNRTHVHMKFFAQNHTYYHFPKYCRFLLNHPVYAVSINKTLHTALSTSKSAAEVNLKRKNFKELNNALSTSVAKMAARSSCMCRYRTVVYGYPRII